MKVSALTQDMIDISGLKPSITEYFDILDQVFINSVSFGDHFQTAIYDYSQFFERYEDILTQVPTKNTHELCEEINLIGVEIHPIIDGITDQSFKIREAMKDHYKKTEKIRANMQNSRFQSGSETETTKVRESISELVRDTTCTEQAKIGVNEIIKLIKQANEAQKIIPDLIKRYIVPYVLPKTNEKFYDAYFACENAFTMQTQLKLNIDMLNAYDLMRQHKIAQRTADSGHNSYDIVQWQSVQMLGTFLNRKNDMLSDINVMLYAINNRAITVVKSMAAAKSISETEEQSIESAANRYFEVLKHFKVRVPENFLHAHFSYSQLFEKYTTNDNYPNAEKIRHFLAGIKQQIFMKWSELKRAKHEMELITMKHNTKSHEIATLFRRLQAADSQDARSSLIKNIQRNLHYLTIILGNSHVRVIISAMEEILQEAHEIFAEIPDSITGFLQGNITSRLNKVKKRSATT